MRNNEPSWLDIIALIASLLTIREFLIELFSDVIALVIAFFS
jgi:hypothetical protein